MNIRTLLIDSSFLLIRSFHCSNIYTIKFGKIAGLYYFFTTIRKLIKEHKINKVVLVWDGENGGVYRHEIDLAYKANRKNKKWYKKIEMTDSEILREKEKEESILKQKKRIQQYAEELFLRQIEVDDIEGDDIIASYCMQNSNKEDIYLFTNDRDFAQLLDLDITILFADKKNGDSFISINRINYFYHFNHHYTNAIIMKIIGGDTSDNIPGVGGIKEDTLLKYFPDMKFRHMAVREICQMAKEINETRVANNEKPLKVFENLLNGIERLKTNYILINLKKPFLNEHAIEELAQLEMPLLPDDRGSKNLYKMMLEDEFLTVYKSDFVSYVEPFYTVITNEKQLFTEYMKNKKSIL